jgi:two-component system sensor histidine kinase ArlS
MPVRLKITFVFSAIVFLILGLAFALIYFYAAKNRRDYIDTRLTNMAVTTGRFLSKAETFNPSLIQKIDSLTAIAFTHKTVQAYNEHNEKIYSFNDDDEDTLYVNKADLDNIRQRKKYNALVNRRDIVYYHYTDASQDLVIIAAGFDDFGRHYLNRLLFILVMSFLAGTVMAILIGYLFSKRLLRPLGKIAFEVNEISAQNLTRRMATGVSHDEWYYLSDTLNRLLDRLQESFELQRRFIANASHELSTPLTSISSQLEVALQKERSAADYQKVMQSIYHDIHHMGRLTHALLDLAKTSANKGGIEIKPVRIDEIMLRMPSEAAKVDKSYSVVLEFDELPEDEEKLVVFGNEELLFTAMRNIVLNACKYSKNEQAIILLRADEKHIRVSVKNKGAGIPAHEFENIFQPFYRIEENRTAGGFGLGLSLAKRIIKLHNGEITLYSEPNGETIFTTDLPSAQYLKGR